MASQLTTFMTAFTIPSSFGVGVTAAIAEAAAITEVTTVRIVPQLSVIYLIASVIQAELHGKMEKKQKKKKREVENEQIYELSRRISSSRVLIAFFAAISDHEQFPPIIRDLARLFMARKARLFS